MVQETARQPAKATKDRKPVQVRQDLDSKVVRALESGVKMARLRLATTERIYIASTGERREHTEWHTVVLWRGQADFAEKYIRKGSQVYVEGKIRSREWTDESSGARRTVVEIVADEVRLLGGARRSEGTGYGESRVSSVPTGQPAPSAPVQSSAPQTPPLPAEVEDLPF